MDLLNHCFDLALGSPEDGDAEVNSEQVAVSGHSAPPTQAAITPGKCEEKSEGKAIVLQRQSQPSGIKSP